MANPVPPPNEFIVPKLYKVTLRGMQKSYGTSYVVANDPDEAYKKVKNFLDKEDIGFRVDRELYTIELLAENYRHTNVGTILYL